MAGIVIRSGWQEAVGVAPPSSGVPIATGPVTSRGLRIGVRARFPAGEDSIAGKLVKAHQRVAPTVRSTVRAGYLKGRIPLRASPSLLRKPGKAACAKAPEVVHVTKIARMFEQVTDTTRQAAGAAQRLKRGRPDDAAKRPHNVSEYSDRFLPRRR